MELVHLYKGIKCIKNLYGVCMNSFELKEHYFAASNSAFTVVCSARVFATTK